MRGKLSASVAFRLVMWVLMLLGGAALGVALDRRWFPHLWRSWAFHLGTFILGAALLRFVLIVSRNTGRFLARMGREGGIPRMETNKLVTEGMYGCMRHPMHFGLLFFPLSVALLLGSPTFIFVIAPLEMLFMVGMIKAFEEREALRKFGDAYREYMRRVPMFNLRPDCLKKLLEPQPK